MRRVLTLAVAGLLTMPAWPVASAAPAAPTDTTYDADGATLNILPPGSNGTVNAADFLALGGTTASSTQPSNYANQLEMYDALNTIAPYSLKESDLAKYYKDASIAPPATPVSSETPKAGAFS